MMRLDEVLDVVVGELMNEPAIGGFSSVACSLVSVKSGSLFFACNKGSVLDAIKQGAYGIVYEGDIEIVDDEIAWVRVESVESSISRMIRYFIVVHKVKLFFVDSVEIEIIKFLSVKSYIFPDSCKLKLIEFMYNGHHVGLDSLFVSDSSLRHLAVWYTDSNDIDLSSPLNFDIVSCELFSSKITYLNLTYSVGLPRILLPHLSRLLIFLEREKVSFVMTSFKFITQFYPLFLNSYNLISQERSKDFQASKFIVRLGHGVDIANCIDHVTHYVDMKKVLVLSNKTTETLDAKHKSIVLYEERDQAIELLKKSNFGLALVCGIDIAYLRKSFSKNTNTPETGLFSQC